MSLRLREHWVGLVVLLAVVVGLALTWRQNSITEDSRRQNAISQSQFNLRLCTKGGELRDEINDNGRVLEEVKVKLYQITKAAAESSDDPPSTRARYQTLADELRGLPTIKALPPTDCGAIVKLYSQSP